LSNELKGIRKEYPGPAAMKLGIGGAQSNLQAESDSLP
jgi:hypothetical protein